MSKIGKYLKSQGINDYNLTYSMWPLQPTAVNMAATGNANVNQTITLQDNQAWLLSDSYLVVEYEVQVPNQAAAGSTQKVVTYPNLFLNMITGANVSVGPCSYQLPTGQQALTVPFIYNLNKILNTNQDQSNMLSIANDGFFVSTSTNNYLSPVAAPTAIESSLMGNSYFKYNTGREYLCPPRGGAGTLPETYTDYLYIPLKQLFSMISNQELITGTLIFQMSLNYNVNQLFQVYPAVANQNLEAVLPIGFSINRINFHYTLCTMPTISRFAMRDIVAANVKYVLSNEVRYVSAGNEAVGTISLNISDVILQVAPNKVIGVCFIPIISSVVGNPSFAKFNSLNLPLGPPDQNVVITQSNYKSAPGVLTCYDYKIQIGANYYPTNIITNYKNGPLASYYGYMKSVVESFSYKTDGSDTDCALPYELWRDYFQFYWTKLDLATKDAPMTQATVNANFTNATRATAPGTFGIRLVCFTIHEYQFGNSNLSQMGGLPSGQEMLN
jgi:hypothetical protein